MWQVLEILHLINTESVIETAPNCSQMFMVRLSAQTKRSDGVSHHNTAVVSLAFLLLRLMGAIYSHLWVTVQKWRWRPSTFDNAADHICVEASAECWTAAHIHSMNEEAFQPLQTPWRFGYAVLPFKRHFMISIFRISEQTGVCVLSSFKCFSWRVFCLL